MILTTPTEADRAGLARLWHDAWHEAHAAHVPLAFLEKRDMDSFLRRLKPALADCRMAADAAGPLGFCQITANGQGELDQLFLAPRARGSGLAHQLLAEGETRLAQAGCTELFLYCLPQNTHALKFYQRNGWQSQGVKRVNLKTVSGTFELPCTVLIKHLSSPEPGANESVSRKT